MGLSYSSGIPNIKKDRILAFIEKDIFVLNNYETVPFKNKNHAIECLIPYHIFHLTADDIKFRGSDVEIDIRTEIDVMKTKISNMIKEHTFDDEGFTPQLLLYHEQRILNSIAQQAKAAQPSKRKKYAADKRFLKVRIPRTDLYRVHGDFPKLRIKIDKD
ncbi:uncharacterized protein VICG_02025 [Vittaforma corneae ATCC 50505]|uniref:GLTSCR protein conserved domain-containing protein n=1 Tax=Vittaforma corneae (strain ATCC 50505) TaxID=993615 RepID=L2GJ96_VITCO|nr:uncharacterized protein VICG_02025 [Vittaforma corneae ATCC 50505]ELA40936.1 hypothetical protein VICG_02025 [Vittaforma corneae ATCC 50505]